MRRTKIGVSARLVTLFMVAGFMMSDHLGFAQTAADSSRPDYLEWPLPAADREYGVIDGKHIWQYVVEQAAISRRYRDQGHPQFWGRIIGTSGDAESAQWLLDKFNQLRMTDTRIQPIDLMPQWMPQTWQVTVGDGKKTIPLTSAQPAYHTSGTQGQGLDLEAVYVEMGSEADFAGLDVRNKAVFISRYPGNFRGKLDRTGPEPGALKRAEEKGAAAVFDVNELPGNLKYQSYPANTNVPTFNLGTQDGNTVRDLIEHAPPHQAPHVHVQMDVQMVPNLKTALVWGTLPGATDETIYVIAHRDGWFDGAGDNAGGIASMLGLAEYFARIPKNQRRRTMIFIGWDGHHNSGPGGAAGTAWAFDHRDQLFAKTALMINDEHPSNVDTFRTAAPEGMVGQTDSYIPLEWYAGGPSRPELKKIVFSAFQEFGVATWAEPSPKPPAGDMGRFAGLVPGVVAQTNDFFYMHTDANTPETVPWTALEAVTRAYAKIIDQVNKLDLKDLQRSSAETGTHSVPAGSVQ